MFRLNESVVEWLCRAQQHIVALRGAVPSSTAHSAAGAAAGGEIPDTPPPQPQPAGGAGGRIGDEGFYPELRQFLIPLSRVGQLRAEVLARSKLAFSPPRPGP